MQQEKKYIPFEQIKITDRQWPDKTITKAPVWCSVDLRDGNQALVTPMGIPEKIRFFHTLVDCGFKEIEVGFPSASETEYEILRTLIEGGHIPDDVTVQVLVQAREELIRKTFEAVRGAKNVIIHFYNSTSTLQRKIVFGKDMDGITDIAVQGARLIRQLTEEEVARSGMNIRYEYSPESFSGTEIDFSVAICEAVMQEMGSTKENPIILNLPSTVEMCTPNTYADQIEYFCRHIKNREAAIVSVHPHNDRGTGVACAELALLAGADRIEGTLFGNGERTGNLDIVNVALNMYIQGVSPGLDFSNIDAIRATVEYCNQLPVHPRHPYVGDLVYTSFSGSHQDAIKKAFAARKEGDIWDMPYLPIDPKDLGRSYEAVIRVNSQSGKGGIAYLLEAEYGVQLPRRLQIEFSQVVQHEMDALGTEFAAADLWKIFEKEYRLFNDHGLQYAMQQEKGLVKLQGSLQWQGQTVSLQGSGNGAIDAFVQALSNGLGCTLRVQDYSEHAIGQGANAQAMAYVELRVNDDQTIYGVGTDANIVSASMHAILSGLQRSKLQVAETA